MQSHHFSYLIRQFQKGDFSAFDEFYDRTRAAVFYVLRKCTTDGTLLEDVMQETYLSFLKNVSRVDEKQNPVGYLVQIAKNKLTDEFRKRNRTETVSYEDLQLPAQDADSTDFPLLTYAKQHLSAEEFSLLELTVIYGYRRVEVAKLLNQPVSSVNWKYHRLLKKLKSFYREVYHEKD